MNNTTENFSYLVESTDSLKVLNNSDIGIIETSLNEKKAGIQRDCLNTNHTGENQNEFGTFEANHNMEEKDSKNGRVKFKNVIQFKKDVVIKKLLKTIDVMNQELSRLFLFKNKVN